MLAILIESVAFWGAGRLPFTSQYSYDQLPILVLFGAPFLLLWLAWKCPTSLRLRPIDVALVCVCLVTLVSYLHSTGLRLRPVNPFYLFLGGVAFYFAMRILCSRNIDRTGVIAYLPAAWAGWFMAKGLLALGEFLRFGTLNGQFTNQNHLALFLAMGVPLVFVEGWPSDRLRFRNLPYLAVLLLLSSVIVQTRCRTAVASLAIGLFLAGLAISSNWVAKILRRVRWPMTVTVALSGLAVSLWVTSQAYQLRPLSVAGRALIWKVSLIMISTKPGFGHGYDQFERQYPSYLADYFQSGRASAVEAQLAAPVVSAFNDYLQTLVDFGLVGGLPYILLWAAVLFRVGQAMHRSARSTCSGLAGQKFRVLLGFATTALVFSLSGFAYFPGALAPMTLLYLFSLAWIVTSAVGPSDRADGYRVSPTRLRGITCCLGGLSLAFLFSGWQQQQATQRWNQAKQLGKAGSPQESLSQLEDLHGRLDWNEAFVLDYGRSLLASGEAEQAVLWMERSRQIRSQPDLLEELAGVYSNLGRHQQAVSSVRRASMMRPWRLTPHFLEATFHRQAGDCEAAERSAELVLSRSLKRWTLKGANLKRDAERLLRSCRNQLAEFSASEQDLFDQLPAEYRASVRQAVAAAKSNRAELVAALHASPPEQLEGLAFQIANMPLTDLQTVSAPFLLENLELAYQVRDGLSPDRPIPQEIFFNYLLPYSLLGEQPGAWRRRYLDPKQVHQY